MSFIETPRFPDDIAQGVITTAEFDTDVVIRHSGHENRFPNWSEERLMADASYGAKTVDQARALLRFFRIARGRAYGFRFKDWLDFAAVQSDGILVPDLTLDPDGKIATLWKQYVNSPNEYRRRIAKPVDNGTFNYWLNAALQTVVTDYTIDYTKGTVQMVNFRVHPVTVDSGIEGATTEFAFLTAHGFTVGDRVCPNFAPFDSVTHYNVISVPDSTHIVIDYDSTGYGGAFVGDLRHFFLLGDTLEWEGDFDVPMRFDADKMSVEVHEGHADITQVGVRELRLRLTARSFTLR